MSKNFLEYNARLPDQKPKLPMKTTKSCYSDTIDCQTLADLISGKYDDIFDNIIIVDCRYDYEYSGGHIINAININQKENLDALFNSFQNDTRKTCIIFHCEYSSHRGPKMYHYFRNLDRNKNSSRYPYLSFPDVYVLKGGYKCFYENFKNLCNPVGYVEMHDPLYSEELKVAHKLFFNQKSKKHRSRSCSDLTISRNAKKTCLRNDLEKCKSELLNQKENSKGLSNFSFNFDKQEEEFLMSTRDDQFRIQSRALHFSLSDIDYYFKK